MYSTALFTPFDMGQVVRSIGFLQSTPVRGLFRCLPTVGVSRVGGKLPVATTPAARNSTFFAVTE